jgi:ubiquinone/menaquinone biosynthesis C-methylase UbiE
MQAGEAFDAWAAEGQDRGMERRHWHTAKRALARMPLEAGDVVLDLGTGSGYAPRALRDVYGVGATYGIDASAAMVRNADSYTDDPAIGFLRGDFEHLPFPTDAIDHCFSMEAFYYARNPETALAELARVLRPGGSFYCAVNYWEEHVHSHEWADLVEVSMTRWSEREYREAFRAAGFSVASQDRIPDTETEIPPADAFPTEDWETRAAMVERYREYGTLLTVGVVP